MSREVHVRFCESRGVRFPPATHLAVLGDGNQADVEALREQISGVLATMGLAFSEAKTRWSTLTTASTSSASTSAGCGSEEQPSRLFTPSRRRRRLLRLRARCGP